MLKERVIYNLINKSKGNSLALYAKCADNFFLRLKGLMFRKAINSEEALIFYQAASIHTFFMRFSLDLVFLDKKMQVIKIYRTLPPGRVVFCSSAYLAIELPPDKISQKGLEIGDILELVPIDFSPQR
ncbi:MAG: DUF192 domain-containing protein [Candidatus Omnitrophota bacterium]